MIKENKPRLDLHSDFPPNSWDKWQAAVAETLKGADYDKAMKTKTYEGITLQPIYRKEDLQDLKHLDCLPGSAPYIRGNSEQGYLKQSWLVAQEQDNPDLQKLNQDLLEELNRGLDTINLYLNPEVAEGRIPSISQNRGVPIINLKSMKTCLNGIDLCAVPLYISSSVTAPLFLALLNAYAKHQGIALNELRGAIVFDPLALLAQKGQSCVPISRLWQLMYQIVFWTDMKAPGIRTVLLDGSVYADAGASSDLELGIILSTAIGYINGLLDKGLSIEQIAPRFQINLNLGSNFFMEIAKVRACRMIWAELIQAFGGSETARKAWIHGITSAYNKSRYDAFVNVLRTSTEAFSAVIGGVDSLQIQNYDTLLNPSTEFSKRISRNQHFILKEEAHFDRVIDPAGGCYYIENLTAQLAQKAWSTMQQIESAGGLLKSLSLGSIQKMTADVSKLREENVAKRKDVFVGINMFADPAERLSPGKNHNLDLKQIETELTNVKAHQNSHLEDSLSYIRDNLDNDFLIDMLTDAWLHNCTLDQLSHVLGYGQGEPKERVNKLKQNRILDQFESLRDRVLAVQPKLCLINYGSLKEYKPRADFAMGFFAVAGIEPINEPGSDNLDTLLAVLDKHHPQALCICSTDENYISLVPELCKRLKNTPLRLILAGYPTNKVEEYRELGIHHFIHLRANAYAVLSELVKELGVEL
ncbi:MAG: methylmalonyl-CoA mutase family protein [Candidatus Cloacimonetes bacterium]|nr:methylmalonyl-CoA mutase family protein [Candidatus Cloacimonadota bacterium]